MNDPPVNLMAGYVIPLSSYGCHVCNFFLINQRYCYVFLCDCRQHYTVVVSNFLLFFYVCRVQQQIINFPYSIFSDFAFKAKPITNQSFFSDNVSSPPTTLYTYVNNRNLIIANSSHPSALNQFDYKVNALLSHNKSDCFNG